MSRYVSCIIALLLTIVMFSCKPSMPDKYLKPSEMADILFDYHLAEGMQNVLQDNDSIAMRAYELSILNKYGVSKADFDSSLVYYTRHTAMLEKVYDDVVDRLNRESSLYGGAQIGLNGEFVNSADTTNVWQSSPSCILSPYAGVNRLSFEIKADSSYHEGDKLMFDFDTQFIYQDGMRDALAVLAVTYANDSVEVVNSTVSSSAHFHLQINNTGRLKIKSVRGFLLHNNISSFASSTSRTTIRLLVVTNIRLIRMHTKAEALSQKTDSVSVVKDDATVSNAKDTSKLVKAKSINGNAPLILRRKAIQN